MMYFWDSQNIVGYKEYRRALIRRHMAPELFPLVNKCVHSIKHEDTSISDSPLVQFPYAKFNLCVSRNDSKQVIRVTLYY